MCCSGFAAPTRVRASGLATLESCFLGGRAGWLGPSVATPSKRFRILGGRSLVADA